MPARISKSISNGATGLAFLATLFSSLCSFANSQGMLAVDPPEPTAVSSNMANTAQNEVLGGSEALELFNPFQMVDSDGAIMPASCQSIVPFASTETVVENDTISLEVEMKGALVRKGLQVDLNFDRRILSILGRLADAESSCHYQEWIIDQSIDLRDIVMGREGDTVFIVAPRPVSLSKNQTLESEYEQFEDQYVPGPPLAHQDLPPLLVVSSSSAAGPPRSSFMPTQFLRGTHFELRPTGNSTTVGSLVAWLWKMVPLESQDRVF